MKNKKKYDKSAFKVLQKLYSSRNTKLLYQLFCFYLQFSAFRIKKIQNRFWGALTNAEIRP